MAYPGFGPGGDVGGPAGHTYGALLARVGERPGARDEVVTALREVRFSGWVAPPENGWVVAIPATGQGTVAAGRRGVVDAGAWLADQLATTVLAVRVLADRQLALVAWSGRDEIGRYVSDPSREPGAEPDVRPDPLGVDHAAAFAAAAGRPGSARDLAELLTERLDPETMIESERLGRLARLLGLPTWLVAVDALPRDIPTGPGGRDLVRLGAGVPGLLGRAPGRAVEVIRRRRRPAPVIADPPGGGSDIDPWLL